MQIEMEFMEQFERGEAPTLEELVERYPDLSEELVEFVLDFVTLEKGAEHAQLSQEEKKAVEAARERAMERTLEPVSSFQDLRAVTDNGLGTLAKDVHLPMSVLDGLERGMIVLESVPGKLFERLAGILGRPAAEIRDLLRNEGRQLRAVHWRAETAPKGGKRKQISFGEALRSSKDFNEEYRRDWLSGAG